MERRKREGQGRKEGEWKVLSESMAMHSCLTVCNINSPNSLIGYLMAMLLDWNKHNSITGDIPNFQLIRFLATDNLF